MYVGYFIHRSQRTKEQWTLSNFTFFSLELFCREKISCNNWCVKCAEIFFCPIYCWLCKHDTDCQDFWNLILSGKRILFKKNNNIAWTRTKYQKKKAITTSNEKDRRSGRKRAEDIKHRSYMKKKCKLFESLFVHFLFGRFTKEHASIIHTQNTNVLSIHIQVPKVLVSHFLKSMNTQISVTTSKKRE